MPVTINGTTGISGVDGTASTPSIQGGDTNTGMFFPAADTIAFAEGGTEVARFDSSGNLGIGTSSPTSRLHVVGASSTTAVQLRGNSGANIVVDFSGGGNNFHDASNHIFRSVDGASERARIDSSGNLLVGRTSTSFGNTGIVMFPSGYMFIENSNADGLSIRRSSGGAQIVFYTGSSTLAGTITSSGSTTAYNSSSDYRLKHDIAPMTGALAKVAALKPCTYKWNTDNSDGEGFIAHELAEVCPQAVTGEKDAVDADGNPVYQGIDTSFLVATLTAAIQELKAIVDAQAVEIAALKGQA